MPWPYIMLLLQNLNFVYVSIIIVIFIIETGPKYNINRATALLIQS